MRHSFNEIMGPPEVTESGDTTVPVGEHDQVPRKEHAIAVGTDSPAKDAEQAKVREVDQDSTVPRGDTDVRSNGT